MQTSTIEEQGNVEPHNPPQKPKPPQKALVLRKNGTHVRQDVAVTFY